MTDTVPLNLDKNSREIVSYPDPLFPLEIWTGNFYEGVETGLPPHWHPEFEYGVVIKGHIIYTFPEYVIELGPGDCIFVNSDRMHYIKQRLEAAPAEMYTVAFLPSLLSANEQSPIFQKYFSGESDMDFTALQIKKDGSAGETIHRLLPKIYESRSMPYGFELQALSLVSRLWLETLRYLKDADLMPYLHATDASARETAAIKRALSFLYAHYDEKLTVEDIADAAYISRNSCFRYFRNCFGKTPLEMLNEHRLSVAASLLSGDKPITEIAFSCGFGSSSYFARLFRAKYGVTPQEYRLSKT